MTVNSHLNLKVIYSSAEGLWINSTLVYGKNDAVLIDAALTVNDAKHLIAQVHGSKKNLTTAYTTHPHANHSLTLTILKEAFPNTHFITQSENALPSDATTITLEDEKLEILPGIQGEKKQSSYVWVPALKTILCGDTAYSGIYPLTAETTPQDRKNWIKILDKMLSLKPLLVIPGYQEPRQKNNQGTLQFMKGYLTFFEDVIETSTTTLEIYRKIKSKYPNLALEGLLNLSAESAFVQQIQTKPATPPRVLPLIENKKIKIKPSTTPQTYSLDPMHTSALWHCNHFGFSTPSGKFMMIEGTIILDEIRPQQSKVKITIPMEYLATGIEKFNEHLKSKEFFDTAQFPIASFESTKIDIISKDTAKIHGTLFLRGISQLVTLNVQLNKIDYHPLSQKKSVGFSATTKIRRSDFGMSSFLPGISDEVKIDIEAEANLLS